MRNSGETSQITNMDELIDGVQILYGFDALTSGDREAAASLVDELVEFRGEKGLNILRALTVSARDSAPLQPEWRDAYFMFQGNKASIFSRVSAAAMCCNT